MSADGFEANARNRQSSAIGWFVLFLQHVFKPGPWYERHYFEHAIVAHRLMMAA